jgi:hypothetical protein
MKQITIVFKMIAACTVLALFAACSGGVFIDPGHGGAAGIGGSLGNDYDNDYDDDDDTGGGGGKPAKLSSSASYAEAIAKLDEIIAYCESHPGPQSTNAITTAELLKTSWNSANIQSGWSVAQSSAIQNVNAIINLLQ